MVDDIDFNPGLWGVAANGLTEFSMPIQNFGTTTRSFVLSVRFFNEAADYVTPGQLIPGGAEATGFNVNITQPAGTFTNWVIGLNPAVFRLPDNTAKIVCWLSTDGTLAGMLPVTSPIRWVVAGRDGVALPGSSDVFCGLDLDGDADVEVTATPTTTDVFFSNPAPAGCGALRVAFAIKGNCPSDFDADGTSDGEDVAGFFGAWDAGSPAGDYNSDVSVDGDDVIAFFVAWDAGC